MPTLVSPGTSSYVIDSSMYISNNAGATIPLFFVATRANKETYAGSNIVAPGTLESGVVRTVTSVKNLVDLYGVPAFRSTTQAGVTLQHHGDCRNEYGLFAAYQFLSNGGAYCYVVRADVDLTDTPDIVNTTAKRVESAMTYAAGAVVAGGTNVGDGTVGAIVTGASAVAETFTLTATAATTFALVGSVSGNIGPVTVGVPFVHDTVSFTITAGLTPFAVADTFSFAVTGTNTAIIYGGVNVGTGTLTTAAVSQAYAAVELWTLTALSPTVFKVVGSVSGEMANAVVGVPYNNGAVGFTINAGLTAWALGDIIQFNIIDEPVYTGTGDGTIAGNVVVRKVSEPVGSNPGTLGTAITGNGSISQIAASSTSVAESWDVVALDATTFSVTGSVSGAQPDAVVGEVYDNGLVSFKVFAGAVAFVAGDTFEFDVTKTSVIVQPKTSSLETWTVQAVTATKFSVTGSVSGFTGNADVGTLYDNGKVAFTITAGLTPFAVGDKFVWIVTQANNVDPLGTTHALKRAKIVQALQAAVNMNEDARSERYEYNLISCPGYPELADELTLLNRSINEEAFIVCDTPFELNPEQVVNWSITPGRQFNTYIGYYYPAGLASNLDGTDIVCAASGIALGIIAYSDSVSYLWFAPAGLRRGAVAGVSNVGYVTGQLGKPTTFIALALSQGQRDNMYKEGRALNPIVFFPGRGIVIWGQKTSQSFSSAMDRINVVRMVCYLKRSLRKGMLPFVFEPNDTKTQEDAKQVAASFLNDVMVKRGLYDFAVISDSRVNTPDVVDRNEMYVYCAIKPVKSVEFLYVPIEIFRTGDKLPG